MNTSPWNKDRIIGQKKPLQISHLWGIRIRLELEGKRAIWPFSIWPWTVNCKLRGSDLVKLKVSDVTYGSSVSSRATVLQKKIGSPVQFEINKGTREAVAALIKLGNLHGRDYLFQSRVGSCQHISTRQYNRIFHGGQQSLVLMIRSTDALHEKNKTLPDIQKNQELPGDPTSVRP
ncbi:hypothetical protein PEC730217_09080 [Pectobacterium carotovorum subsp. carotovorum]|nr:hypothetical protein PEC311524_06880 [Pectobacterium carotovorum subsp. carotovorum]GKW32128.1 hypothetical protein PEC730217_09080 [Pectobacterium carotovorum subsp. carotovorum]